MRVSRADEILASLAMPALQSATHIGMLHDDCLIMCAGFEDRALGVLKCALEAGSQFRVLIINYLPFVPHNRLNEIHDLCKHAGLKATETVYDRQNPAGFCSTLMESIDGARGRIFLDVSGMSRLLIVQCLVALSKRGRGLADCVVTYTEAEEYPPSKSDVEEALKQADDDPMHTILLLSAGVFDVTVVPELSSTSITSGQSHLVAFPTFSADQLIALLSELGPSRVTLIHGIPPSIHNRWRTDAISRINRLDTIPHDRIEASTLDYRETLRALLELYARTSERQRLLVSPTGSKLQSVAVGIVRAFVDDIQIVYPTPKSYCSPTNYTRGIAAIYMLSLESFSNRIA